MLEQIDTNLSATYALTMILAVQKPGSSHNAKS